ncbi:type II secretion system F family protein [Blastopirellula sp. J2-11]|uniref:type II secretion system F family protein n=1 Tax=Blastopirellula sp. J2-11 TaxID=2943192 RepID=UPI0021C7BAA9|nr:type II secretion system F family protein [Blastopirellula sp. J2-11]UUO05475.1 type II secretion system F family protein [Blastopirellula sp. J2-11]
MDLSFLNWAILVPLAVFGLITAGVWWLIDSWSPSATRAEDRLDDFKDPIGKKNREDRAGNAVSKVLEKATPAFAAPLQPKNAKDANALKERLTHAGFRSEAAPNVFLGLKFASLLIGLIAGGGLVLLLGNYNQSDLFKGIAIAGISFYIPSIGLWYLGKKRKEQIFRGLPDALDLMVVCVEAGLGLDQAMRRVSEEMKKTYRVIAEEFGLCNFQLQVGRQRSDVLHELGNRTGVDDLRSLAAILIQADKFGSSISQALRVQSDSMRTRRRQIAEEKAAKTAVKMIFPLVFFIFPGIFVVLVGPAAITVIREMLPMMAANS